MKHIHDILSGYGLAVPEDRRADFDKEVGENYETIDVTGPLRHQLKTANDGLKAFEGVDVNALNGRITQLTQDLAAQAAAHQQQLDDMDFDRVMEDAIRAAKGKNVKAIRALVDEATLKASKNRAKDAQAAVEAVKQTEAYLFGAETPPPYAPGPGINPPPTMKNSPEVNAFRMAAGLKAE